MSIVPKITIEINGREIPEFIDFKIRQSIYHPNEFEITCRREAFEGPSSVLMENSMKMIGTELKIVLDRFTNRHQSSIPGVFFKGIVTDIRATQSELSHFDNIIISGKSPDFLLRDHPGSESFLDMSIGDIAGKVMRELPVNVVKTKSDPSFNVKRQYIVRYNESRYDFLRRLAVRFGSWFYNDGTELIFGSPSNERVELCLGQDLSDFGLSIKLNPLNVKYLAFNPSAGKTEEVSASDSYKASKYQNDFGEQAFKVSKNLFNMKSQTLYNHLSTAYDVNKQDLDDVVQTTVGAQDTRMSSAGGKSDNPMVNLGCKLDIKALRSEGNETDDLGEYLVTSVTHYGNSLNNYHNVFTCIAAKAKVPDLVDPMDYPRCEPEFAEVTDNSDKDKRGRVRVRFHWQTKDSQTPWIPIIIPHAGEGRGYYFIPEIGDQVLVGFLSGDAEQPYVMGGFFHGNAKPGPTWHTEKNDVKVIRTRGGNVIELVDKEGKEEINIYQDGKKPAGGITFAAGESPKITITSTGKLVLKAKDIEIESSGPVSIKSGQDLKINGGTNVEMESAMEMKAKAGTDMNLEAGTNLKAKGGVSLEVTGGASAKLEGGGMATVKGGVVMIN